MSLLGYRPLWYRIAYRTGEAVALLAGIALIVVAGGMFQ